MTREERVLQRLQRQLSAQRAIGRVFANENDANRLIEKVCRAVAADREGAVVGVVLFDGHSLKRFCVEGALPRAESIRLELSRQGAHAPWLAAYACKGCVLPEAALVSPETAAGVENERGTLALPIFEKPSTTCVLLVESDTNDLDEPEIEFLREISTQLGQALGRVGLVTDDGVTGSNATALRLQTCAVRAAANGIVITDLEGKVVLCNPAFLALTGYSEPEILGQSLRILQSGRQDKAFYRTLWDTIQAGKVWRGELVNRRKDGSLYHEDMTITPIVDDRQNVSHYVAIKQDVTERKRAEQALIEARERQQIALDAADLGMWCHDLRSKTISLDERAQKLVGLDDAVVSESTMLARCHPDDVSRVLELQNTAIHARSGRATVENRVLQKDGSYRWISNLVKVVFDHVGNEVVPNYAVGMARDITESKLAEVALRESEARYRTLVDNIDGVVYTTDLEGRITFINRAVERYGYTVENFVGRSRNDFIHPDDQESTWKERLAQVDSGVSLPVEFRVLDASGKSHVVRSNIRRQIVDGKIVGVSGVLLDVTAQREAEEQLRAAQKMEAIGRLAGGVAHDFNNLLSVILSYTQLSVMDLDANDPLRQDLEEVVHAAKRAEALTRQLLAFSRRQVLRPAPLDVGEAVASLGKMLQRLIGEDIELRIEIGASLFQVLADRGQVEQVVTNLIVNARDAILDGGCITVSVDNTTLDEIRARGGEIPPGDYVQLTVNDTGCGMTAETLARVYEPFFTTKPAGKGTGLGLSTVYGIVRQSGGSVVIESEIGVGTTCRVFLPRLVELIEAPPISTKNATPSSGNETVLVVEDEVALRNLIQRVLQAAGYRVYVAKNPGDALLFCERHGREIHLVLTDVVMPGMNGKELAARIAPLCPSARVIYMSGYSADVLDRHGIDEVFFLAKPFDIQSLTQKLRDVLERNSLRPPVLRASNSTAPGALPTSGIPKS